ncbi:MULTISPECIES: hypothetical protein [Methylorubrum]|jgi:hypothetical protein|uniref:Uncharacterized protein n=2 Tax=Methylorubrum TaxID=2282523 RepID=A0ABU9ZD87_9HYPH|nr:MULTISPECIES: hypothetical protein [Methylorubrum]AWI89361.1 hypothetical protein C0214_14515 [Methylobacterium sp. DM1]MBY0143145.1 hypothetical protein [Methylorubrum populi]MRI56723.1 hypothetical protein [Methylobacterium sp. DB1607]HEV2544265.1 hypothetical protein [Methylobacterium sp.]MBB5761342.1 hypothetical protein [Methylorubrum rhodesianum]
MNPLVPLSIVLLIPIAAVCAVLFTDTGIEPALFYAAVKTFAILFVVGGAISFAASRLAERTNG